MRLTIARSHGQYHGPLIMGTHRIVAGQHNACLSSNPLPGCAQAQDLQMDAVRPQQLAIAHHCSTVSEEERPIHVASRDLRAEETHTTSHQSCARHSFS